MDINLLYDYFICPLCLSSLKQTDISKKTVSLSSTYVCSNADCLLFIYHDLNYKTIKMKIAPDLALHYSPTSTEIYKLSLSKPNRQEFNINTINHIINQSNNIQDLKHKLVKLYQLNKTFG